MKDKHNSKIFLLLFLGALSAFGPFVIDLYLPALPLISHSFHTSASMTQLTLTTSMAGLAIGQLFIGPISDKFGRKLPLTISLIIYTISTIAIFFTKSIEMFIFMRVIQGFSSAGSVVISRAIARDLYSGHELTKFFSLMMVINSLAPILSPILGSILIKFAEWHSIFIVLSMIGIVLFVANFNFKESLLEHRRLKVPLLSTYATYKELLVYKKFMIFVGILTFALGSMFAYIAASPFIFQEFYALSSTKFAICFGANGLSLTIGAFIASRIKEKSALSVGIFGLMVSCLYLAFVLNFKLGVLFVIFGFFIQMFFSGFIFPTASALAMNCGQNYAGSASAMLGFFPFLLGGIVSPMVGLGDIFLSTTIVIGGCFLGAFMLFLISKKYLK
ncbi:multidrug effflux MFS transporter [Campylobacter mucosalis]|uniref:Drug resistance transporter, Bcr/CflA family n=1 Tax=Campylobacter mucosalis CCUG 21559 TaxID=1032067 RepID=A0A6G5QJ75_9BACT|nr:multidrug effflux MFS transporter [Campylobacter mucosalis]QCD45536.1 drug resistance transporter, Bcr/CflA family [Campylobacter mucosalis CCUG 21559]